MADAGLTNGAFYAHFDSKEDLVASTVADQLREQRESFSAQSLEEISSRSTCRLSTATTPKAAVHRPPCSTRSPRSSDAIKRAYTDGLLAMIDDIAARLAPDDPQSARVKTLGVFALMVGTLQVSRALADRQLADDVLEQGIQNALALWAPSSRADPLHLGCERPRRNPRRQRQAGRSGALTTRSSATAERPPRTRPRGSGR